VVGTAGAAVVPFPSASEAAAATVGAVSRKRPVPGDSAQEAGALSVLSSFYATAAAPEAPQPAPTPRTAAGAGAVARPVASSTALVTFFALIRV
jgi:hypothetical protein